MNKRKILSYCFVLFIISLTLLTLTGCGKNDGSCQLATPSFVNIITEDNKKLLVTDNNPYASGYVFGICTNEQNKDDITKYVRLKCLSYYCDVTELFSNAKTYYYYAQAMGELPYTNSPIKRGTPYKNTIKLNAPLITHNVTYKPDNSLNSCIVSWESVQYATGYDLYINSNQISSFNSNQTSVDLTKLNNGSYLSQNIELNIQVVALAPSSNLNIENSDKSNTEIISEHIIANVPHITLNGTTLSWNSDKYATGFEIDVASGLQINSKTITVGKSTTSVDLKYVYNLTTKTYVNCLENLGEYSIRVRALNGIKNSDYSNAVAYTKTEQLSAPKIDNCIYYSAENKMQIEISLPKIMQEGVEIKDPKITAIQIVFKDSLNNTYEQEIAVSNKNIIVEISKSQLENAGINISNLSNGTVSVFSKGYAYYTQSATNSLALTIS